MHLCFSFSRSDARLAAALEWKEVDFALESSLPLEAVGVELGRG